MNEFLNDFLIPLIPWICFLSMCFQNKKQKEYIEELENEIENLKNVINHT